VITITDLELDRSFEDVRNQTTTVKVSFSLPDKVFRNPELMKDETKSLEKFIVDLLPALPPESIAEILAGAAALRLTR